MRFFFLKIFNLFGNIIFYIYFCICNKNYYIIGNFLFFGVNYILYDKYLF